MSREIDQDQNYAIVILNELRFSQFKFKEENVGTHKIYTFTIPNESKDLIEPEEIEENSPQIQSSLDISQPTQPCQSKTEQEVKQGVPKNLIKNFICAFTNFLNEAEEESSFLETLKLNTEGVGVLSRLRQQLALLHKSKRYNTEMLQTILSVGQYKALFQLFLSEKAGAWVSCGRMRNKEAHSNAISYLQDYIDSTGHGSRRLKFNYRKAH